MAIPKNLLDEIQKYFDGLTKTNRFEQEQFFARKALCSLITEAINNYDAQNPHDRLLLGEIVSSFMSLFPIPYLRNSYIGAQKILEFYEQNKSIVEQPTCDAIAPTFTATPIIDASTPSASEGKFYSSAMLSRRIRIFSMLHEIGKGKGIGPKFTEEKKDELLGLVCVAMDTYQKKRSGLQDLHHILDDVGNLLTHHEDSEFLGTLFKLIFDTGFDRNFGLINYYISKAIPSKYLKQLIEWGFSVNQKSRDGDTPLSQMLLINRSDGNPRYVKEDVEMLLNSGADRDIMESNREGITPLYLAEQKHRSKEVIDLISKVLASEVKKCISAMQSAYIERLGGESPARLLDDPYVCRGIASLLIQGDLGFFENRVTAAPAATSTTSATAAAAIPILAAAASVPVPTPVVAASTSTPAASKKESDSSHEGAQEKEHKSSIM